MTNTRRLLPKSSRRSRLTIPIPPFWSVPNARREDENHDSCNCDCERFQLDRIRSKVRLLRETKRVHALHGGYGHAWLSTDRQAASPTDTDHASAKCTPAASHATKGHEKHAGYAARHERYADGRASATSKPRYPCNDDAPGTGESRN